MTETTRTKADIWPSTQDPISRWLDIFIPMTGLPRARQTEIRAELDDHLRARTADLMITGQPEPDAVQQAVNELGETAHLARQFRTALKPKRNTLMHTALIAAAGAAITLSAFSLTAHTTNPSGPGHHARTVEQVTDPSGQGSHMIADVRDMTYGGLFDSVAEISPIPVLVHWDRLEDIGIDRDTELGFEVDALPAHVLYRLIRERTQTIVGDPVTVEQSDDLIEFSVQSHFDGRSLGIVAHDISSLIAYYEIPEQAVAFDRLGRATASEQVRNRNTAEHAGREILEAIIELVSTQDWREMGGSLASASVVGPSLVVNAPERIHDEIRKVMVMMQEEVSRFELERAQAAQEAAEAAASRAAEAERQRAEAVESLRAELDKQVHAIVMLEERKRSVKKEIDEIKIFSQPFNRIEGETDEQAKVRRAEYIVRRDNEVPGLLIELDRINLELEDTLAYRAKTRDRLIGLTSQSIMSNEQITQRQQMQGEAKPEQGALGSVKGSHAD